MEESAMDNDNMSTSVYDVLTNGPLLLSITSYQCGLPYDMLELAREYNDANDKAPGLLPRTAIKLRNLPLLRRVCRYYLEHDMCQDKEKLVNCESVWSYALQQDDVIPILEWLNNQPTLRGDAFADTVKTSSILQEAITRKSFSTLAWLLTHRPEYKTFFSIGHVNQVAMVGDLRLFQWLEANDSSFPCSEAVMDAATQMGQLEMIRYLHENRTEGCTASAMDQAASNGHLDVVRFLHEYRTEGGSQFMVTYAARNGHLDIVRYLYEHRSVTSCFTLALAPAASAGHLDIVKYLLDVCPDSINHKAIQAAAQSGHLPVVQFFHEQYHEHCTAHAMAAAAGGGHLEIVQYLDKNCDASDESALVHAAYRGRMDVVKYLARNQTDGCLREGICAAQYHRGVARWLTRLLKARSEKS